MCCIFTTLVLLGPRAGILIWWLVAPLYWQTVYPNFIWPLLGFFFLPWTTLMYAVIGGHMGLVGFDWVWIGLALLSDIGMYAGGAYGNRDRVPGYSSSTA